MYTIRLSGRTPFKDIDRFFKRIKDYTLNYIVGVKSTTAQEVFKELRDSTPVDTGFARGSWSVGSPRAQPRGIAYSKTIYHPPPEYNGPARIRFDRNFTIENFAPYIEYLNAGHSTQALPGFIETAVDTGLRRAAEIMRNERVEYKSSVISSGASE